MKRMKNIMSTLSAMTHNIKYLGLISLVTLQLASCVKNNFNADTFKKGEKVCCVGELPEQAHIIAKEEDKVIIQIRKHTAKYNLATSSYQLISRDSLNQALEESDGVAIIVELVYDPRIDSGEN